MIAAELPVQADDTAAASKIAVILERVTDPEARSKVLAIGSRIAAMESAGYQVSTPVRVRPRTQYVFAEWHLLVKNAGFRCVLSFFINEAFEPTPKARRK
ncbi:hypothetical protein [Noviherbaspirillum denitrificans]|uniref:Uncharacterized protein n=1 Tax=Noviherbaspirillum denitrificans TaxID=1968433 RepID=A0A254T6Z5_9BURK|nr:hypothetical protein [Noviherbaspirillum denitrificans]OWW18429.1 hypothetical protein AYR66_01110 [Noviherbaspirillum denitrificans]OWW19393.1 hypothetical protein AYR66_07595 [Noviherbaspirillum denitrificans]